MKNKHDKEVKMLSDRCLAYEDMKESVVAFVDILGFNNRVKLIRDLKTFVDVAETIHTIKLIADSVDGDKTLYSNFNCTSISDSIILSAPYTSSDDVFFMLLLLHRLQFEVLFNIEKTLLRGFVTIGPVYHKESVIFGTGYSSAYECERTIGHAPRIVVSPEILKSFSSGCMCLKKDTDGYYFIDYLNPLTVRKHSAEKRKSIEEFIRSKLEEFGSNLKVYPKYKWLENYFGLSLQYFSELEELPS